MYELGVMGDNDMCSGVCASCVCVLIGDMDVSNVVCVIGSLVAGGSLVIGVGVTAIVVGVPVLARCGGARSVLACSGIRSGVLLCSGVRSGVLLCSGVRSDVGLRLRQPRLSRRSCLSL